MRYFMPQVYKGRVLWETGRVVIGSVGDRSELLAGDKDDVVIEKPRKMSTVCPHNLTAYQANILRGTMKIPARLSDNEIKHVNFFAVAIGFSLITPI